MKNDPIYGPTVGRRRDFGTKKKEGNDAKADSPALQTFSIGNEFDFLPSDDPKPAQPRPEPKRDSLMEALMGALNEESDDHDTETIIFQSASDNENKQKAQSAPPSMGVPPVNSVPATDAATAAATTTTTTTTISTTSGGSAQEASSVTPSASESATEEKTEDDMDALLADSNMELDDDIDMDALLADGDDLLDMDADLEDLENMLSQN